MKRQRKSGNAGHRLAFTKAVPTEVRERQRKTRQPKPVTVIHADGRRETRSANSFGRGSR